MMLIVRARETGAYYGPFTQALATQNWAKARFGENGYEVLPLFSSEQLSEPPLQCNQTKE